MEFDCCDPKTNILLDKQSVHFGKVGGPPLSRCNPQPSLLELWMRPPSRSSLLDSWMEHRLHVSD